MSSSFPNQLLATLDILVAEREKAFIFRPIEPVPDFCTKILFQSVSQEGDHLDFRESAFLMHFLEEAEPFWKQSSKGRLRSGPWIESDGDDEEYSLEASAVCLEDRKFIIIQLLGVDYEERRTLLQSARERLLLQRRLEDLVKERTRELALTKAATIECLASLTEARDPETGSHIKRTQTYVRLLAEHLRLHPKFRRHLAGETVELLYRTAPLHDIGKVGIPDRILLKPGKLTVEEFAIAKKHTTHGRNAIESAEKQIKGNSFLKFAGEIAYTHHEKWDGSGYPEGLKGEQIPVSGRLMALADVYDALVTRRVYKPPYSHDRAVAIITEGKGGHFDPDVVDAFLELREEFRRIAFEYADTEEEQTILSQQEAERSEKSRTDGS
jgi:response regulator RpfG family c-di-GMP phosphodiesterase